MEHYPCRHGKKKILPRLLPIQRPSPPVLDQESLELCTRVWNIPTHLTYPTRPTYIRRPLSYGNNFLWMLHAQKIEDAEMIPTVPPNSHLLQYLQW